MNLNKQVYDYFDDTVVMLVTDVLWKMLTFQEKVKTE